MKHGREELRMLADEDDGLGCIRGLASVVVIYLWGVVVVWALPTLLRCLR